jgi:hypothetical protein
MNLRIVKSANYLENLTQLAEIQERRFLETRNGFLFKFLKTTSNIEKVLSLIPKSKAQLFQDLFVLETLSWKESGYFVEFGATDGINLSNTYLLEKDFGWTGLLAEPGRNWSKALIANRECLISNAFIWGESGQQVDFLESRFPEFSTAMKYKDFDGLSASREIIESYSLTTISLCDFLEENSAPNYIDYISIDTEGSELEILEKFDFSKYRFGVLTVEHNHSPNEKRIESLLSEHGYIRVFTEVTEFDGWYIDQSFLK